MVFYYEAVIVVTSNPIPAHEFEVNKASSYVRTTNPISQKLQWPLDFI